MPYPAGPKWFAVILALPLAFSCSMAASLENISSVAGSDGRRPVRIVAFGDSTTAVWSEDIRQVYAQRLPGALAERGVKAEVINSGVSDHTTADGTERFERDVRRYKPDLVIIQFGINDSWIDVDQGMTEPRLTRDQYKQNLRTMVTKLKEDGSKVILMTPNPMRWSDLYRKMFISEKPLLDVTDPRGINRLLDRYAEDVRGLAKETSVPLVDVHSRFEDYGRMEGRTVRDLLLTDGIHPNDKGHALIAGLLAEQIVVRASEFQVKVIRGVSDLPETFSDQWKPGDYLISDGTSLILMGGTDRVLKSYYQYPIEHTLGSVLAFVPAGKGLHSDLVIGAPYIRIKNRSHYLAYSSFRQEPQKTPAGSMSFLAAADYQGKKNERVTIRTQYRSSLGSGKIDIVSTVKNTGTAPISDFHFSLYVNADQVYSFSPFDGEVKTKPSFWVYPKDGHYLGWIDLNPVKEIYQPIERESLSTDLKPGKTVEARYVLLADERPDELLKKVYRHLGIESEKVSLSFSGMDGNLMEVVIQDAASSIFFRSFFKKPLPLDIFLPEGLYKVRANVFPAVVEKALIVERGEANQCLIEPPPCGKVKVSIRDDQGRFVPGKVSFIGLGSTKTPYFNPENPIETKTGWESSKNSCFPQKDGLDVALPVGTYLVSASRGPEFTLDQKVIEVVKGERQELLMQVDRVIHVNNLISVDPHLHTLNSDGAVTIPERIKSVVAEGVDVAISTDHNYLSDFPSALKELGLDEYMAALIGQEVSAVDSHHVYMPEFNRYPLQLRTGEPGGGAIDIRFFENNSPMFGESRRKDPGALIQVNHPRGEESYFTYYQLDPESAATALEGFDTSFDILEVMNGPFFGSGNKAVIQDWLHLLNRGYYYPIVGSSDSHETDGDEPGYSRTYVSYERKTSGGLDEKALLNALKKGRSFLSNGPLVEFRVNGKYSSGDTFTAKDGKADIWIRVQSVPWVSVDEVRIIINGERKIVIPVEIPREKIVKFQGNRSLGLEGDSYIVIEVAGNKSLYPVVQKIFQADGSESSPLPYALTNPVFVDVDGNGRFDPPWPEKIKLLSPVED